MHGYQPPSVETPRSSIDSHGFVDSSAFLSPEHGSARSSYDALRNEVTQMEVEDPPAYDGSSKYSSIRSNLSRRITHIRSTLSSMQWRFSIPRPSFERIRSCTPENSPILVFIARCLLVLVLLGATYFLIMMIVPTQRVQVNSLYDAESLRAYIQSHVSEERIERFLARMTSFDHVAGTQGDYTSAKYVEALFEASKLEHVELNEYDNLSVWHISFSSSTDSCN